MPSLMDMMAMQEEEGARPKLDADIERIRLRDCLGALNVKHEFRVGMIVRQKPQAVAYKQFGDNNQVIVVELLEKAIISPERNAGSCNYRMRIDMIVGSLEGGKEFCLFHVDSRRFEPVETSGLEQ